MNNILIDSAAVVLMRDSTGGPLILLVKRSRHLAVMGGAWVFPGGKVEKSDGPVAGTAARQSGRRHAAVRETAEETGLKLDADQLVQLSCWTTPSIYARRFKARFFAARSNGGRVTVDGGEIVDHRWMTAPAALAAHQGHELHLSPPAFVTLTRLCGFDGVEKILAYYRRRPADRFDPRLYRLPDGKCTVYREDVAYNSGRLDLAGPRHRLWMRRSGWRYEYRLDASAA